MTDANGNDPSDGPRFVRPGDLDDGALLLGEFRMFRAEARADLERALLRLDSISEAVIEIRASVLVLECAQRKADARVDVIDKRAVDKRAARKVKARRS